MAPPAFMLARRVRRRSTRWPRGCGASRRVLTASSGRARRLIASLAAAISAALICAKSFLSSTSRSETVSRASISVLRLVFGLLGSGEQRLEHALRRRAWALRSAAPAPAAPSRRSAGRDSRACGRRCGRPDRTARYARAASRTPRAASNRHPRACRRPPPRALRAHRAPRRGRPEFRPRAAHGRSRGCFRRGGLRRLRSLRRDRLTPPPATPPAHCRAAPSPCCLRAARCRPGT